MAAALMFRQGLRRGRLFTSFTTGEQSFPAFFALLLDVVPLVSTDLATALLIPLARLEIRPADRADQHPHQPFTHQTAVAQMAFPVADGLAFRRAFPGTILCPALTAENSFPQIAHSPWRSYPITVSQSSPHGRRHDLLRIEPRFPRCPGWHGPQAAALLPAPHQWP